MKIWCYETVEKPVAGSLSLPLRTEFPVFWEFLGIPRNSQKFPVMQMNSWEFLGIEFETILIPWGPHKFWEILNNLNVKVLRKGVISEA